MKITKVEPVMLCYKPENAPRDGLANIPTRDVFLVKIYTDEGITGIGEGFALGSLRSTAAILDETITPLILGEDPLRIEYLWNRVYQQTFRYGRRGILMAALSAVDIALWDIKGKKTGLPVYKLLGGANESVVPYASAGYYMNGKTCDDLAKEALSYKAMGFGIMKMKIGGAPMAEDFERIHAVREAVGDAFKICVDANNAYDYSDALRMARFLEKENAYFFEEPLSSDYLEDSIRLVAATDVRIAGYETQLSKFGMRDYIVENGVDIAQVDVIWTGGITECLKVASLAECWNKKIIPHFSAGMVSFASNLQFALAVPNCSLIEYTLDKNPLRDELCTYTIKMHDGIVTAPDSPGIGVELDEAVVAKYRVH